MLDVATGRVHRPSALYFPKTLPGQINNGQAYSARIWSFTSCTWAPSLRQARSSNHSAFGVAEELGVTALELMPWDNFPASEIGATMARTCLLYSTAMAGLWFAAIG